MKFKVFFAWYDFWIGLFYDKKRKILYINPLPCIVFSFASNQNVWLDGKWKLQERPQSLNKSELY